MIRNVAAFSLAISLLAGCGGGGGGSHPVVTSNPSASPGANATAVIAAGGTEQSVSFGSTMLGIQAGLTVPATSSGSGSLTATLSAAQPAGVPTLTSVARIVRAQAAARGTSSANASQILGYITFTAGSAITLTASPAFTFVLPAALPATNYYAAYYNGSSWQDGYLSGTASGASVTYASNANALALVPGTTYAFVFYASSTSVSTPTPAPFASAPASSATTSPGTTAAFLCPTSDSTAEPTSAIARAALPESGTVRHVPRNVKSMTTAAGPVKIAVVYDNRSYRAPASSTGVTTQEAAVGANLVAQMALTKNDQTMRVLSVPAASLAKAESALRAQSGVISVGTAGAKRRALSVTTPYWTNDPYYQGFTAAQNATAAAAAQGSPQPATFEKLPYAEAASVPGQWDMHAIGLEHANAYSQITSGSSVINVNALGSSSVHIAIIDTGEDANHPELAGKIVRQRCFITSNANVANPSQSTGTYSLDPDGHGTDVSGIAAADSNNGLGFTGVGGNATIFAYRVFPTPDDTCATDPDADDPSCETDTTDIASAITDAVNAGANVISMSLGGSGGTGNSGCTGNGVDTDATEGNAVQYAISHNVIVVAAAGNSATDGDGAGVTAPGCDAGVIAVGATSLDDGQQNGAGTTFGGTSSAPVEYVASYSQYGTPGTMIHSANAWGIVAPGGDPTGSTDDDDLHWIENLWTTTPYESSASDQNFFGECDPDYPNGGSTSGTLDCRTLIAGTSMATPHVAGAVALILSVSSAYSTPAQMKSLLCSTADQLTATGTQNQGCGRLNVYRAMATALNDPTLP